MRLQNATKTNNVIAVFRRCGTCDLWMRLKWPILLTLDGAYIGLLRVGVGQACGEAFNLLYDRLPVIWHRRPMRRKCTVHDAAVQRMWFIGLAYRIFTHVPVLTYFHNGSLIDSCPSFVFCPTLSPNNPTNTILTVVIFILKYML